MSNSSDCKLFDYYMWVIVEQEANKTLCNIKDELKARIIAPFTNLNKETIGKACKQFQSFLGAMVEAKFDFFKLI